MAPSSPKVVFLTAGGAGMYCGSCMRDNTLVRHLAARGWNIELVPAYTPIRTDEEDVSADRVFFGGINLYLLQTFPLLAHLPGWVFRWLDSPSLIRRATANASIPVDARQLGEMTLATLNGEHGLLRKEHARFVDWLVKESRPSLLNLTNLLIGGSIPLLRRRLPDVPILVTLQGDDLFLGQLTEPWKSAVIARMRELAAQADGFLTFSHAYADLMAALLEVPRDRFHLVPLGIDADPPAPRDTGTDRAPALGFFARLSPEKGFHHAVDAFLRLAQKPGMERTTFHFGGWLGARDRPFVEAQIQRLADGGLEGRFFHHGSPDRAGKSAFFRGIDLFSVPADFFEPKGLYVLEALAAGVPVIQPAHGAFPELLSACPAARLVPAHDPGALAEAWWEVLCSPDRGAAMGALGPAFIRDTASATRMAERTAEVYQQLIRSFLFRSR